MSSPILLLAAAQAGLLLWAAVHLSNAALRPGKVRPILWGLVMLGLSLAIAYFTAGQDQHRAVCSLPDCLILALTVAGIRVFAVNKESDQLALDYEESRRRAAEAAEAARNARKVEELKAAAALLETRIAAAEKQATEPVAAPRHLTSSLLRGGAPSPRRPTAPRK